MKFKFTLYRSGDRAVGWFVIIEELSRTTHCSVGDGTLTPTTSDEMSTWDVGLRSQNYFITGHYWSNN